MYRVAIFIFTTFLLFTSMNAQDYTSKQGGICFRVDDNQTIDHYKDFDSLFTKYDKHFTFAVNMGLAEFKLPYYVDSIRTLQGRGNELMDHSPDHRTNYFETVFDTLQYSGLPGVDHIIDQKICLQFDEVDTNMATRSGYVNIDSNAVINPTGGFDAFDFGIDIYLYFPKDSLLVVIEEFTNDSTVHISDVWGDSLDLGLDTNVLYYNLNSYNMHLTLDAINVLGNETLKLASPSNYNLQAPTAWIQPGGHHPQLHSNELKNEMGALGYLTGAVYPNEAKQVYNEYNPDGNRAFAMQWADFRDDELTAKENMTLIADGIAKNFMLISHTHFTDAVGGWQLYLAKVDSLLEWSTENNIPIISYKDMADSLYNTTPNPYENIFPVLNSDIDSNLIPDGYDPKDGVWLTNDGPPQTDSTSYAMSGDGEICFINNMGGIERGYNDFEIWTKGAPGNSVEVNLFWGTNDFYFKFPANTSEWKKYSLSQSTNGTTTMFIPDSVTTFSVFIRSVDYTSGTTKIGGMWLAKPKLKLDTKIFLEGAFVENDSMSTALSTTPEFPKTQPYSAAPFNYTGTESVTTVPNNVVDWILVELRDTTNLQTVIATRAAFLLSDGHIVDLDGASPVDFLVSGNKYYVVVKHRNHLAVMSKHPKRLSNNKVNTYDFTTGKGKFYGEDAGSKKLDN